MRRKNLKEFYNPKKNYIQGKGDIAYNGSLTPAWQKLKKIKCIEFNIGYTPPAVDPELEVEHENQINVHVHKPRYYQAGKKNTLRCDVFTKDIFLHTLRSLAKVYCFLQIDLPAIVVNKNKSDYGDYLQKWQINDSVLFCRTESFMDFIKYFWLLEKRAVSLKEVKRLAVENELKRLFPSKPPKLNGDKLFTDINSDLTIFPQQSACPAVNSFNLNYKNRQITVVQLPWGKRMAYHSLLSILAKNPKIKTVAFVGGVGYIKEDHLEIDDIFVPTHLIEGNSKKGYRKNKLQNGILKTQSNLFFKNKQVATGGLCSIVPKRKVMSNTAQFSMANGLISSFDMEFSGFYTVLKNEPQLKMGAIYYVMDLPMKGLGLGNTYYNTNFLKSLFSDFNRGKYFAFEKALNFLTS